MSSFGRNLGAHFISLDLMNGNKKTINNNRSETQNPPKEGCNVINTVMDLSPKVNSRKLAVPKNDSLPYWGIKFVSEI